MLWDNTQADEGTACKAWAKDLDITLTNISWGKIYQNVHKGSINVFKRTIIKLFYDGTAPPPSYTNLTHSTQTNAGGVTRRSLAYLVELPTYPRILETGTQTYQKNNHILSEIYTRAVPTLPS